MFARGRWLSPRAYHNTRVFWQHNNAKTRANRRGIEFQITVQDVHNVFPKDLVCPALGVPLIWGGVSDNSPSLDRIDPTKGYVLGNIAVISNKANRIKSNATPDEVSRVAAYLQRTIDY